MEVGKICRTCLGLNGPLLSIYDDHSDNCIANMLSSFTKTRPNRSDNLPEKVCLACISEINRCYSFKLKCENSNRTLRQLVPDAAPEIKEVEFSRQVEMCNKFIQTLPEKKKTATTTKTAEVQTVDVVKTTVISQQVQTEEWSTSAPLDKSPPIEHHKKLRGYKRFKLENIEEKVPQDGQNNSRNVQKTQMVLEHLQADDEPNENEIILELLDEADANANTSTKIKVKEKTKYEALNYDESDGYYELSESQLDYNITADDDEVDAQEKMTTVVPTVEPNETAIKTEGVAFETMDEQDIDPEGNLNFIIYDNENGETEVVPHRRVTRSGNDKVPTKNEFKCAYCAMSFVSKHKLYQHMFKKHNWTEDALTDHTSYDGIDEEIVGSQGAALKRTVHKDVVSGEAKRTADVGAADGESEAMRLNFFCERCNAGFALRKSYNYHIKQNICTMEAHKCDQCERVFISEANLKEHKVTHVLANTCNECHKVYATVEELTKHMVEEHKRSLRNQCHVCKKVFTMMSALRDHLRTHSGEKPYLCPVCGKSFSQNPNLKQHIRRHAKEKKFKCDACPNTFVTKAELFSHQRTHTGDAPFKCEYCGSTFTTSSSLLKHRRKHTGERPYACDICPMRFAALNVLKNHRRTHTGEKPFNCAYCGKAFRQKGDCQIHQRSHTRGAEKCYNCFCGKKFTSLSEFRVHSSSHTRNAKHSRTGDEQAMHITIIKGTDSSNEEARDAPAIGEDEYLLSAMDIC